MVVGSWRSSVDLIGRSAPLSTGFHATGGVVRVVRVVHVAFSLSLARFCSTCCPSNSSPPPLCFYMWMAFATCFFVKKSSTLDTYGVERTVVLVGVRLAGHFGQPPEKCGGKHRFSWLLDALS